MSRRHNKKKKISKEQREPIFVNDGIDHTSKLPNEIFVAIFSLMPFECFVHVPSTWFCILLTCKRWNLLFQKIPEYAQATKWIPYNNGRDQEMNRAIRYTVISSERLYKWPSKSKQWSIKPTWMGLLRVFPDVTLFEFACMNGYLQLVLKLIECANVCNAIIKKEYTMYPEEEKELFEVIKQGITLALKGKYQDVVKAILRDICDLRYPCELWFAAAVDAKSYGMDDFLEYCKTNIPDQRIGFAQNITTKNVAWWEYLQPQPLLFP